VAHFKLKIKLNYIAILCQRRQFVNSRRAVCNVLPPRPHCACYVIRSHK